MLCLILEEYQVVSAMKARPGHVGISREALSALEHMVSDKKVNKHVRDRASAQARLAKEIHCNDPELGERFEKFRKRMSETWGSNAGNEDQRYV